MRPDRRSSVVGVALIGIALLVLDPFGLRSGLLDWNQGTRPADGSPESMATTASDRADEVALLADAMAADPILSLALLSAGLGLGLVAGSTVAYLHQRRRLQRGERDG